MGRRGRGRAESTCPGIARHRVSVVRMRPIGGLFRRCAAATTPPAARELGGTGRRRSARGASVVHRGNRRLTTRGANEESDRSFVDYHREKSEREEVRPRIWKSGHDFEPRRMTTTPQRRQPRLPPLPREDSRKTVSPTPLVSHSTLSRSTLSRSTLSAPGRGVRAKGPLSSSCLSNSSGLSLHSLLLYSLGLRPRAKGPHGLSDQRVHCFCGSGLHHRGAGPIPICLLPIGADAFRQTPSGADTEVRPPANLQLAPGGRGAWMNAQRTGSAPIEISSLPIGTGSS